MLNADLFRDRRSQLSKVVLLLCGFYFALAFAGQAWKAKGLGEMLAAEQAKLDSLEAQNAKLENRLSFLQGKGYDAYVEGVARSKLGMVKKGDKALFVVPDPKAPSREAKAPLPAGTETTPRQSLPEPTWEQWVHVFFP